MFDYCGDVHLCYCTVLKTRAIYFFKQPRPSANVWSSRQIAYSDNVATLQKHEKHAVALS